MQQKQQEQQEQQEKEEHYNGKEGTQPKLSLNVSVFLGGEVLRPPAPPPMPSSSSFFLLLRALVLLVLVSLRWCKDDDVNELVNKSRFHNASIITQHGKSPCKNARLKFKNAAQIIFNILQIPCNMKGSIFHMSQMPCKIRGSISTIQVDVAE